MKQNLLVCTMLGALAGFSQGDPAEDLNKAVQKLEAAKNYTWASSTKFGDREARVSTGKKGSGGHTLMSYPGRESSTEALICNGKVAFKTDSGWRLASADAEGDENRRSRFMARMAENYQSPAKRMADLVAKCGDLKVEEGTFSATLGEEAAKELMRFRGRGRGRDGAERQAPAISGASGSVKFQVKDGILARCELQLSGKMSFNDQERDISRTVVTEFDKVGSTSFDIAEEAAGLLSK